MKTAANVIAEGVLSEFDTYCPLPCDQDTREAIICVAKVAALRGMEFITSQTNDNHLEEMAAPQISYGFMGMASSSY